MNRNRDQEGNQKDSHRVRRFNVNTPDSAEGMSLPRRERSVKNGTSITQAMAKEASRRNANGAPLTRSGSRSDRYHNYEPRSARAQDSVVDEPVAAEGVTMPRPSGPPVPSAPVPKLPADYQLPKPAFLNEEPKTSKVTEAMIYGPTVGVATTIPRPEAGPVEQSARNRMVNEPVPAVGITLPREERMPTQSSARDTMIPAPPVAELYTLPRPNSPRDEPQYNASRETMIFGPEEVEAITIPRPKAGPVEQESQRFHVDEPRSAVGVTLPRDDQFSPYMDDLYSLPRNPTKNAEPTSNSARETMVFEPESNFGVTLPREETFAEPKVNSARDTMVFEPESAVGVTLPRAPTKGSNFNVDEYYPPLEERRQMQRNQRSDRNQQRPEEDPFANPYQNQNHHVHHHIHYAPTSPTSQFSDNSIERGTALSTSERKYTGNSHQLNNRIREMEQHQPVHQAKYDAPQYDQRYDAPQYDQKYDQPKYQPDLEKTTPLSSMQKSSGSSRKTLFIWLAVILVLLGVGGGLAYYFMSRSIDVGLTINVSPSSSHKTTIRRIGGDIDVLLQLTASAQLDINYPTFFAKSVDNLALSVYVVADIAAINGGSQSPAERVLKTTNSKKVALTDQNNMQLYSKTPLTATSIAAGTSQLKSDISLNYTPSKAGALNDPIFNSLMLICIDTPTVNGNPNRMTLKYQLVSGTNVLDEGSQAVSCPFIGSALDDLKQAVASFK